MVAWAAMFSYDEPSTYGSAIHTIPADIGNVFTDAAFRFISCAGR
jgi:hypothetical protein